MQETQFNFWIGKILWRREWLSTPVFLPLPHGQRSLTGYSPWGSEELDMTECWVLDTHTDNIYDYILNVILKMFIRNFDHIRFERLVL